MHVSFVDVHEGRAERPWDLTSVFNGPRLLKELARQNFRLWLVWVAHRGNRALVRCRIDCKATDVWQGLVDWNSLILQVGFLLDLAFFCL